MPPPSPKCLFVIFCVFVAFARHWAMPAVTAAGGLTFFLVFDKVHDDCRNDRRQNNAYNYRRKIFRKPSQHDMSLLFRFVLFAYFDFFVKRGCFMILLEEEHVNDERKNKNRRDKTDNIDAAGEDGTKLVNHKRNRISEEALITDCEPSPLRAVHFSLDCADSCEAGCAKKVEYKETVTCDTGEGRCKSCIYVSACAVKNAHRADDVLFCDKTGNGSNGCLPFTPAERCEDPADTSAYVAEN